MVQGEKHSQLENCIGHFLIPRLVQYRGKMKKYNTAYNFIVYSFKINFTYLHYF